MAQVKLVQDKDASTEVKAVFDDIRKTRDTDYVNNIWRALAVRASASAGRPWQRQRRLPYALR